MPSSAQLKLAVNYLVARLLILTQLACADITYLTQFSLKAKLQLKNKLLRVGGAAVEMENKAISASNLKLKLTEAELGKSLL